MDCTNEDAEAHEDDSPRPSTIKPTCTIVLYATTRLASSNHSPI